MVLYANLGFSFCDVDSKGECGVESKTKVHRIDGMGEFCPRPADAGFAFGLSVFEMECIDLHLCWGCMQLVACIV